MYIISHPAHAKNEDKQMYQNPVYDLLSGRHCIVMMHLFSFLTQTTYEVVCCFFKKTK